MRRAGSRRRPVPSPTPPSSPAVDPTVRRGPDRAPGQQHGRHEQDDEGHRGDQDAGTGAVWSRWTRLLVVDGHDDDAPGRRVVGAYAFPHTLPTCPGSYHRRVRVLILEDEPLLAEALRDGLRLEAIASDVALDGDTAIELLRLTQYDVAVLDRDVPGPSGDEVAAHLVASGVGTPVLMLTAADRLDDLASGFGAGADDYLTKPFEAPRGSSCASARSPAGARTTGRRSWSTADSASTLSVARCTVTAATSPSRASSSPCWRSWSPPPAVS